MVKLSGATKRFMAFGFPVMASGEVRMRKVATGTPAGAAAQRGNTLRGTRAARRVRQEADKRCQRVEAGGCRRAPVTGAAQRRFRAADERPGHD
jgi:hypothetical protein